MTPEQIRELLVPDAYTHPVERLELLTTHISWVILTGRRAYKLKKPVDFGFLDFSTIEKRLEACREELRLNRRTAPQLYLGLSAVIEDAGRLRLVASDALPERAEVVDYAVRMREFPQAAQLDRQLEAGRLGPEDMTVIGSVVADFHAGAPAVGPRQPWGSSDHVLRPVRENFEHLNRLLEDPEQQQRLRKLAAWSEAEHRRLKPVFAARRQGGFIRECHGDLHLTNLARMTDTIVAFDCIEFNPGLRWVDVMSDAAFLIMDLEVRGQRGLAWGFLNAYLEHTGDYAGMAVLRYYLAYRSLVRAKVAALRLPEPGSSATECETILQRCQRHIDYAESLRASGAPVLVLMHGVSGSGKTVVSGELLATLPALRMRSDIERKRLHGLAPAARSDSGLNAGLYTPEASQRTYRHLREQAGAILRAGWTVIVDAAFLTAAQRRPFVELADALGLSCILLACSAPREELEQRVHERMSAGEDASEATLQVLERQLASVETPSSEEGLRIVSVNTSLAPGRWGERLSGKLASAH